MEMRKSLQALKPTMSTYTKDDIVKFVFMNMMKWAMSRKKGLKGIFYQNVYFSFFWMYIILRLVCEHFSRIACKKSFVGGPKHGVYAAASFSANVTSWCLCIDTQTFTSVILYMNIILIAVTVWW